MIARREAPRALLAVILVQRLAMALAVLVAIGAGVHGLTADAAAARAGDGWIAIGCAAIVGLLVASEIAIRRRTGA